jgi:Uma2 family endonuclease
MSSPETVLDLPLTLDEQPWVDPPSLPPTDLPDSDGEPMESPWHAHSGPLLKAGLIMARGGHMTDYYVGVNMFVYYSWKQVRNNDFKGPDLYVALNVDGQKPRRYWAIWDEEGRYPDVILEFLSESTEKEDLGRKRAIYETTFRVLEYFCIAPQTAQLMGWRRAAEQYEPIPVSPDGRIWSETLQLWLGAWHGVFLAEEHTWPRWYHPNGELVLLPEESLRIRAEAEAQRAEAEAQRAEAEAQRAEAERQAKETAWAKLRELGIDPTTL